MPLNPSVRVLLVNGRAGCPLLVRGKAISLPARSEGVGVRLAFSILRIRECELKKGDYVRFDVDVNAKRREHYHLKAFNVEAMGRSNNVQQVKTSARSSGVLNGDSTSAHSTSGVKNNKEDIRDARMERLEVMLEALMLSQRSTVAGSSGSQ